MASLANFIHLTHYLHPDNSEEWGWKEIGSDLRAHELFATRQEAIADARAAMTASHCGNPNHGIPRTHFPAAEDGDIAVIVRGLPTRTGSIEQPNQGRRAGHATDEADPGFDDVIRASEEDR